MKITAKIASAIVVVFEYYWRLFSSMERGAILGNSAGARPGRKWIFVFPPLPLLVKDVLVKALWPSSF